MMMIFLGFMGGFLSCPGFLERLFAGDYSFAGRYRQVTAPVFFRRCAGAQPSGCFLTLARRSGGWGGSSRK
jgi:hypothetical protein